MTIHSILVGHYRIPLPTALSDSTHGTMTHFELITVRLVDREGAPNRSYLEAHGFGLDPYLAHPLQLEDGFAVAPERAGHGVQLDWGALGGMQ